MQGFQLNQQAKIYLCITVIVDENWQSESVPFQTTRKIRYQMIIEMIMAMFGWEELIRLTPCIGHIWTLAHTFIKGILPTLNIKIQIIWAVN